MAVYTIDNRPARIQWEARDWITRTLQNCKNLIMLQMTEIPYDRLRGLDTAIYDMPITTVARTLREEIDRVILWEIDATVRDVRAYPSNGEADAPYIIEVDVAIPSD